MTINVEELTDGIAVVHIRKWIDFVNYINDNISNYISYIWRGHKDMNWKLEPTLDRMVRNLKCKNDKVNFALAHLDRFRYATRGRRGSNPRNIIDENEWWAIGQHHGLATPLLDWTTSPFVAAYFAFIEKNDDNHNARAVYALHRPSVENKLKELVIVETVKNNNYIEECEAGLHANNLLAHWLKNREIRPQIEFIKPLSDENQRLVSQGGLFTRSSDGVELEDWISKQFKGSEDYILTKFIIPNDERAECLRLLNRMNINHLSLFPDITGASCYCNLYSEIDDY